jgi:hypothetical protein
MIDDNRGGRTPYMPDVRVVRGLQGLDLDRGERSSVRVVQPDHDMYGTAFCFDAEQLVSPTCVVLDNPH